LSLLVALLLAALCHAQNLPLTIHNRTATPLKAAPVRGGVPFGVGQLKDGQRLTLTDSAGRSIPCATRPTAHWYDGSVKWLLVDTQVDLPAGGETTLQLAPGGAIAPVSPQVKLTDTADAIIADTGPARFVFSKKQFGLPSQAWVDLNSDGKCEAQMIGYRSAPGSEFVCEIQHDGPGAPNEENWLREAGNGPREKFTAAPTGDYKCEVENANPLRATIKLSGWLVNSDGRKLVQYIIRAQAFAGKSDLRLLPTFVYAGKPKEDFIRAMYLRFPRMGDTATAWAFGGETAHQGKLTGTDDASLYEVGPDKIYHLAPYDQDKTVRYTVTQNGKETASGKEAPGWARLSDKRGRMELAVRDFWQMHPKQLKLQRDAMTFYLWPEHGNRVLDLRRRYDEIENTYHYDLSLWPFGGEGVGVTHELSLRLGPSEPDTAAALSAQLNAPLLLECTPEYYASTNAFGRFSPVDKQRFPHLEAVQEVGVAWIDRNQRQFHWDGMIDYGDTLFHGYNTPSHYGYVNPKGWCSRGYVGWMNDDGGLTNGLFVQYLRSGDYQTFRLAENMARHSMDVDTCHYCSEEPRFVGGGHRHDQQHWGNGTRGYGTATHGIIDYYLLTGSERALDVARETAGYHIDPYEGEDEDRIGGLIRFWEISGESKYKQAADQILREELANPASPKWLFQTTGHFRMVLNTSTNFMYYLTAAPPADTVGLRDAITKTIDANRDIYMSSWEDPGSYMPLLLAAVAADNDAKYADALAALLQRVRIPLKADIPPDFLTQLRTMPFEDLPPIAIEKWGVNNIYSLQLNGFNAFPYIMAALDKSGLDETGYTKVVRVQTVAPPFEEIFDTKKITGPNRWKGKDSFMYNYQLENGAPDDRITRSKLILYEDGKPLGPAHNAHIDTMENGLGRWSHWGTRSIQFSTSDNTDPRTNGRQYKIVNPAE
ncbi:MAG: hypothetical protein ACM3VW_06160, partial [Bacteroidota bacterium]